MRGGAAAPRWNAYQGPVTPNAYQGPTTPMNTENFGGSYQVPMGGWTYQVMTAA